MTIFSADEMVFAISIVKYNQLLGNLNVFFFGDCACNQENS